MNNIFAVNQSNNAYFKQVNGFRTILFFAIIVYHYCFHYFGIESYGFVPDITVVWASFFFLSGYFLKVKDTRTYWNRKLLRTIIPFWISIILIWGISKIADNTYNISIKDVLLNCFLFPVFTSSPFIDGAHWFVMQLIFFYVLFWVLILLDSKIGKHANEDNNEYKFIRWVVLFYGVISVALTYISIDSHFFKLLNLVFKSRLVFVCFGYLSNCKNRNKQTNIQQAIILVAILFYFCRYQNFINFIYFMFMLSIVLLVFKNKIKILEHNFFQILGTYSLYIYLIHQKIGYIIIEKSPNVVIGIVLAFVYSISAGLLFGIAYNKLFKK